MLHSFFCFLDCTGNPRLMTVHSGTFQNFKGAEQRDLPPVAKAMDAAVPLQSREQNLGTYPPALVTDLRDDPTCIPPHWVPSAYLPPGWVPTQVLGLLPAPLGLTVLVPFRNKNGEFGFSWSNYKRPFGRVPGLSLSLFLTIQTFTASKH